MKCNLRRLLLLTFLLSTTLLYAQSPKPPIMGWSSWNNFRVHINEQLIKEQADAMVARGVMMTAIVLSILMTDIWVVGMRRGSYWPIQRSFLPV